MIKLLVGVDVSKASLDFVYEKAGELRHHQVSNDRSGHEKLKSIVGLLTHVVMERSGPYYLPLAVYLKSQGIQVYVANSLYVKRFIQMKGEQNKSDKKDAYWIKRYGEEQPWQEWQVPDELMTKSAQMYRLRGLYVKQLTMLYNQMDAIQSSHYQCKEVVKSLTKEIKRLKDSCEQLDKGLDKLIKEWEPEMYRNLQSIPGVGKQVAMALMIKTYGFSKVTNYRQLISMAGLSPKEYSSGSSVRAKVRISKRGGHELRKLLYLSSMSAIRHNPQCKALFERMKCRGKNGKVALIAVSNKKLKQAFAIAKSGVPYHADYRSKLVVN
ncbi:MAG: IS110 family transposase [Fulvivirga sp.]